MRRAAFAFIVSICAGLCQAANYSDIWWNPAESGWGITLADHGSNLFGVWYTYRADGKPVWFTIPGGSFSSDRSSFTGDVYVTTGPSFTTTAFDPSQVVPTKVGTATIDFAPSGQPPGSATFSYSVNGISKSSHIERQPFGNAAPSWGNDFTELWYNPAQSGWGVSLAQHGDDVFGVWYTYGTDGQPTWFVVPGVQFSSPTAFSGKLFSATGPYFGNATFDASAVHVTEAGTAAMDLDIQAAPTSQCDAGTATFTPVVDTAAGTVQYQRTACTQPFGNTRTGAGTLQLQPKTCSGTYNLVAVEPSGCPSEGSPHSYVGRVSLTGIDWTRSGHQTGSLTVTDIPSYFLPMYDDMMMYGMMMGDGMGQCAVQTAQVVTVPLDFTLAGDAKGMSTSGTANVGSDQFAYDIALGASSISGHISYSGGAVYTQAFTATGSFSCTAN